MKSFVSPLNVVSASLVELQGAGVGAGIGVGFGGVGPGDGGGGVGAGLGTVGPGYMHCVPPVGEHLRSTDPFYRLSFKSGWAKD